MAFSKSLGVDIESDCRVVFNEITKEAIKESFKNPRPIDMDLSRCTTSTKNFRSSCRL